MYIETDQEEISAPYSQVERRLLAYFKLYVRVNDPYIAWRHLSENHIQLFTARACIAPWISNIDFSTSVQPLRHCVN